MLGRDSAALSVSKPSRRATSSSIQLPNLDRDYGILFQVCPVGDTVEAGDVLGTQETNLVEHRIMVPVGAVDAGQYLGWQLNC